MIITAGMMLAWIALVPVFPAFAGFLNDTRIPSGGLGSPSVTNTGQGLGLTRYLAYQAVLTRLVAFLLYILGWWNPTFEEVMALFALILVDSILRYQQVKALYIDASNSGERRARL